MLRLPHHRTVCLSDPVLISLLIMSRPVHLDPSSHRLSEDMRRLVVELVEGCGFTRAEAARVLGVSHHTITNTLDHFARTGDVKTSHGGGAQHIYNGEQMEQLRELIHRQPGLTSAALVRKKGSCAPPITDRTIRRYRHELDLTRRHQRITAAPQLDHVQQREAWAWEHRRDPVCRWLHSDESTLCVTDTGDYVWIKRGEPTPRLPVLCVRFNVNVWGVVWDDGRIFVRFTGHLTSAAFIALLEEHLLPLKENISNRPFLLDLHPVHNTNKVREWFTQHNLPYIFLPPQSPQFNAIEECWSWIKRWVRGCAPKSPAALREDMDAACDALPQSVINAYLLHTQNHVRSLAYKDEIP